MTRHPLRLRRLIPVAALLGATVIFPSGVAYAEDCTAAHDLQIGYSTVSWNGPQPHEFEGASANLTSRNGFVLCTKDPNPGVNFSTAYVMLQGTGGWAQSGIKYQWGGGPTSAGSGDCPRYFAEDQQTGSMWQAWYHAGCAPQNGSVHNIAVQTVIISGVDHLRENWDTIIIHQSTFGPQNLGFPLGVTFNGETEHYESHVPGTSAAPEDYSSMHVQLYSNNSSVDTCGNAFLQQGANPPRWGVTDLNCDHIRYWTNY